MDTGRCGWGERRVEWYKVEKNDGKQQKLEY